MSRACCVWLLTSALCAFVGCGGGEATDSGAVAENTGAAPSASGGDMAAMPSGGAGASQAGMEGAAMAPGMNAESYGSAGAGDAAAEMAGMMPGAAGYPAAEAAGGADTAAMAEAYAATAAGAAAAPDGTAPAGDEAAMAAMQAGYAAAGAAGAGEGAAVEGALAGGPGYPGGPGAVEEKVPDGFDGKAILAFRRGKEKDALQFLYAYALTSDAGAESLLPTMRWVSGLRQPLLAVRWGVGFVVTAPRNFNGDPKPVGSNQTIPTRGAQRDGGGGGGRRICRWWWRRRLWGWRWRWWWQKRDPLEGSW